jgi:hypothetical protein
MVEIYKTLNGKYFKIVVYSNFEIDTGPQLWSVYQWINSWTLIDAYETKAAALAAVRALAWAT